MCINLREDKDRWSNLFTSMLPPNSDHVMIHLGSYNHVQQVKFDILIFHRQPRTWSFHVVVL